MMSPGILVRIFCVCISNNLLLKIMYLYVSFYSWY